MALFRQILFWVLVTLAAGFVGYVGRYGAEWLLKRRRMKKEQESMSKEQAKVEKKRLKATAKAEKKRSKDAR